MKKYKEKPRLGSGSVLQLPERIPNGSFPLRLFMGTLRSFEHSSELTIGGANFKFGSDLVPFFKQINFEDSDFFISCRRKARSI